MKPRIVIPIVIVLAILAGFFIYPALPRSLGIPFPESNFKFGLDIRGGAHLVYQADTSQITPGEQDEALSGLKDVIERRVNIFGVAEPVITVDKGNERLVVELAGVLDTTQAIELIGTTPFLEFRSPVENIEEAAQATTTPIGELFVPTELTGRFLQSARLGFNPQTNEPIIELQFDDRGAEIFAQLTRDHIGQPIAIYLDGLPLSAPIVQQEIAGGQAQITGVGTVTEARDLARSLNAGALPVPITLVSQQTVGPALGAASLNRSLVAGAVGFALVVLYLILYYRLAGVLGAAVLTIYALFVLAIFKLIGVTLTLAGIVGFLLTLGIAVDASILIFERMKDELRAGSAFAQAVENGFTKAKTAIRDAYISTLLTAAILYQLSGSVRGFAVTLVLGVITSYAVAFIVGRAFLRGIAGTRLAGQKALWRK